ncbi:uncharacterized protein [Ambystoma mexicanum]|uniref:uncharacterized protein isoform X1 n=1 Tax=Ambystoma mexicanum TaxID=8296 RepID=UPI0037E986AC
MGSSHTGNSGTHAPQIPKHTIPKASSTESLKRATRTRLPKTSAPSMQPSSQHATGHSSGKGKSIWLPIHRPRMHKHPRLHRDLLFSRPKSTTSCSYYSGCYRRKGCPEYSEAPLPLSKALLGKSPPSGQSFPPPDPSTSSLWIRERFENYMDKMAKYIDFSDKYITPKRPREEDSCPIPCTLQKFPISAQGCQEDILDVSEQEDTYENMNPFAQDTTDQDPDWDQDQSGDQCPWLSPTHTPGPDIICLDHPSLPPQRELSPLDDQMLFNAILKRAADHFEVATYEAAPDSDFVANILKEKPPTSQAIPLLNSIKKHPAPSLLSPSLKRAVNPRVKKVFCPSPSDPLYIQGHATPDSLVVTTTRKRAGGPLSMAEAPPDKDCKKLYAFGKQIATSAAYSTRIANNTTLLASYSNIQWGLFQDGLQKVPEPTRSRLLAYMAEGRRVTHNILKNTLDSAETAGGALAQGTLLKRHAWLKNSSVKPETRAALINKPVKDFNLFGKAVDDALQTAKKEHKTLNHSARSQPSPSTNMEALTPAVPFVDNLFPGLPMDNMAQEVPPGLPAKALLVTASIDREVLLEAGTLLLEAPRLPLQSDSMIRIPSPVGGRLPSFIHAWEGIASD